MAKQSLKKSLPTENQRTKCEVYSRPVGYLRAVSSWNNAKVAEYHDRKTYKV